MQGTRALTYVLRDEGGQLRVDDLHLPVIDRPTSLKTSMELLIPIHKFIAGIDAGDIARLQRTSSDDLNRLVWLQTDTVPQVGYVVPRHLQAELSAIKIGEGEALVALGDGRFGAQVRLTQEYGRHVVDEVLLIAGPESAQRERMKRRMRLDLAARSLRGQGSRLAAKPDSRTAEFASAEFGSPSVSALAGSSKPGRTASAPIVPSVPAPIVAPLDETFASPQVGVMRPGIKPSAN